MPWIDQTAGSVDGAVFTIHPDKIPAGDTLLIPYEFAPTLPARPGGPDSLVTTSMLVRNVPGCVPSAADSVYTPAGIEVR
jgi:hypothetical protein